jgi:hypothetical protein
VHNHLIYGYYSRGSKLPHPFNFAAKPTFSCTRLRAASLLCLILAALPRSRSSRMYALLRPEACSLQNRAFPAFDALRHPSCSQRLEHCFSLQTLPPPCSSQYGVSPMATFGHGCWHVWPLPIRCVEQLEVLPTANIGHPAIWHCLLPPLCSTQCVVLPGITCFVHPFA